MESSPSVESPCLRICIYDPAHDLCTGCFRRLAEIGAWPRLSETERLAVIASLAARREAYALIKA